MDWMEELDNGLTGRGILFVISSVSGGGKTTVIKRLMEKIGGLHLVVSHTTRKPREGEQDGREYLFVSREVFKKIIKQDGFLEWANVYDHYYGTSKKAVADALSGKVDAILDIDVQGAIQVRDRRPDSIHIFIVPPGGEEQERRLRERATETNDELTRRLEAAREELALVPEYDYAVLNDDIETTVDTVASIVISQRCRPGKIRNQVEGETSV